MVIHTYTYTRSVEIGLWLLPLWGFLFQLPLYRLVSHLGATYLSCQQLINTLKAVTYARYIEPRAAELVCYRKGEGERCQVKPFNRVLTVFNFC